jgi:O-antigen/teichoic acid export membrane protein
MGQVGGRAVMLVFRLIAANLLGAGAYGSLVLGIAFTRVLGTVGTAGWDHTALRYMSEYHGRGDRAAQAGTLQWCSSVAMLGGLLVASVLFFFAADAASRFDDPALATVLRILSLGLPLLCVNRVVMRGLQALQRPGRAVLAGELMPYLVATAAFPLMWIFWEGLEGATLAHTAGFILAGILGMTLLRELLFERHASLPVRPRALAGFAMTMLLFAGAQPLVANIDRFMVGLYLESRDVGVYDATAILSHQVPIFLAAFNTIVFAQIGALYHAGRLDELRALYRTVTRWVMMLTLPLCASLILIGDDLLALFGEEFPDGHALLLVLVIGQMISAASGPVGGFLMMTKHERWVLANTLVLGVLNIIGNIVLIPMLGVLGAAIATAFALACWNLAGVVQVYILHRVQPFGLPYAKQIALALVAVAICLPTGALVTEPYGDWVVLACCLVTYSILSWRFGTMPEDGPVLDAVRDRLSRLIGRR